MRIIPLLHFTWLVLVDVALSTVHVALEIITPNDHTEEAILGVDLPGGGSDHLLLLSAVITLSPGTAVVETRADPGRLYVHILHVKRRDALETQARKLAELACAALPTSDPEAGP